ncbi:MAG: helicase [Hyphomonadaceae bacterium]|nr:helicase [Hyphomonadaceae bacterium]
MTAPPRQGFIRAVLGPTNTGKTHLAIERMLAHRDGIIGLPLRLLAREIYDRVVREKGAAAAALVTGEEKIAPDTARYFISTVEAMPLDRRAEFLAVDEIQLARDHDRGHVFTDRILRARGSSETMLLGSDAMRPMIRRLLPDAEIIRRERLSTLSYAGPKKLTKLPKRTAIVAFSAEEVYAIAELIRRQRGGAAIVMGALSPRTRNAQVALYQSGEVDFLIATDAIGMGLNMDVDHVAFASAAKFDGRRNRPLRADEVAQIAGRAGRFQNDGAFGETGDCRPLEPEIVHRVESHDFEPIEAVEWRNDVLEFASVAALLQSLQMPPDRPGLMRVQGAEDEETLKRVMLDDELMDRVASPASVRRLWEACQIPDFRRATIEEHARFVGRVAGDLLSVNGRIPEDWAAKEIAKLDRVEGDLDVLQARIAHMRTWAYIANRADWIADAGAWRERARAIEDRLSDALHELLTQRFIDRRTSALLRGLKREDALSADVSADGEVAVEGHHVGRLDGFVFIPDPAALGLEGRAVRNAALRALGPEIERRLRALARTEHDFELAPDGTILWRGAAVAMLKAGANSLLKPRLELIGAEGAAETSRRAAVVRMEAWLQEAVETHLRPLLGLSDATRLGPAARGLAYQLLEAGGALTRAEAAAALGALPAEDRAALAQLGVKIGRVAVHAPSLLKRRSAALWSILFGRAHGVTPFLPPGGAISAQAGIDARAAAAAGFIPLGPALVRIDRIEKAAAALAAKSPPTEAELARLLGRPERELAAILRAGGFRQVRQKGSEGAVEALRWRLVAQRPRIEAPARDTPFAALAELRKVQP